MSNIVQAKADLKPVLKLSEDVQIYLDKNGNANVRSKADFEAAGIIRNELRKYLKDIESVRKELVAPFNEAKDEIQTAAKKIVEPLEKALKAIDQGMMAWSRAEEARIAKANEKLLVKAEETQASVVLKEKTKAVGFTMIDNWKVESVDLVALVAAVAGGSVSMDAISANVPYLNSIAKSSSGKASIPGVKFKNEPYASGATR